MELDTASLFFASLTLVALSFVVVVAALAVLSRVRGGLPAAVIPARDAVAGAALPLALAVALTCLFGSLSLSEYYKLPPCVLCWYQRICMYPLSLLLLVGIVRRDPLGLRRSVVPLAGVGAAISVYHYVHERFPDSVGTACTEDVPCSIVWIWRFHFVSIPLMALAGFLAVITLVWLAGIPQAKRVEPSLIEVS